MRRPSSTAPTIVAKLSSVRTMSATFFVTSVPVMPMPTPMSALLMDGASLTPSPVIATMSPRFLNAFTICTLCAGDTRANTRTRSSRSASASSDSPESSSPVMHSSARDASPSCLPMANAVPAWSPVIITVFTPARRKVSTASSASGRIGSFIPTTPKKVRFLSASAKGSVCPDSDAGSFLATASVRSASCAI